MNSKIELFVTITWSKIMAFLVLFCAVFLDVRNDSATAFMFAIPFIVFLISGKQYFDSKK